VVALTHSPGAGLLFEITQDQNVKIKFSETTVAQNITAAYRRL